MYEEFYRFKEKPFSLTPDPKFLYLSKQHQGALDHMLYGIRQREGFMVIMGDVGTGKTTLCRCLLDRLDKKIEVALILNPLLSDMDLLRTCVHDLRVKPLFYHQDQAGTPEPAPTPSATTLVTKPNPLAAESRLRVSGGPRPAQIKLSHAPVAETVPEAPTAPTQIGAAASVASPAKWDEKNLQWLYKASKKELIDALNAFLLQQYEKGGSTVLIIDEAQNLSLEVLEQLRILSNLETEKEKLLQIIFVGQLELGAKLKLDELKQLNQRISIRYEITPLSKEETRHYIEHRILVAGAKGITFGRATYNEIYNYSRGYPRLINLVCDRTLLAGFNAQEDTLGLSHVKQAIQSLHGEEEKSDLDKQFTKSKALFIASILFFISGMAFFFFSGNASFRSSKPEHQKTPFTLKEPNVEVPPPLPPANEPSVTAPSPVVEEKPVASQQTKEEPVAPPALPIEKTSAAPVVTTNPPTPAPAPATVEIAEKITPVPTAESANEEKHLVVEKTSDPLAPSATQKKAEKESYRIQITSVSTDIQATDEVKQLKKDGYKAYWKKADSAGQVWYVVYVGPFESLNTAKIHLNALKQSGRKPILFSVSKSE